MNCESTRKILRYIGSFLVTLFFVTIQLFESMDFDSGLNLHTPFNLFSVANSNTEGGS